MVHALRVFRHHLLGSGAPRPPAIQSDFTLRTDNQAVSWLRTKRDINRFLARWLDEIEEFRFDIEHVPGRLNPADPLTRRPFPGPPTTGEGGAVVGGRMLAARISQRTVAIAGGCLFLTFALHNALFGH